MNFPQRDATPYNKHKTHRVASLTVAIALALGTLTAANAATINIETATIADLNKAFAGGLTSEKLVEAYLKRIDAYDKKGPAINTVITMNPKALEQAKALDAERKAGKVRGPLHGIPIVLKDNFDTFDLPTTAGSQMLEGSIPPDDAFVVKKLREAGAIIVAKVNLSEWAGGGGGVGASADMALRKQGVVPNGFSSAGGQTHNPHDLTRGPAGSSGGTGAGIAAAFAQFGLGTDTGGSIRGPSSANGIVGLKPTLGLLSRDGIVPLTLSFDTGGPMARSVTDIAVSLGVMTGVDAADAATQTSAGKSETDYTKYLKVGALKGARIGVARDFMGQDAGTDAVIETAIAALKKQGAVIVDPLKFPQYLLDMRTGVYTTMSPAEFKSQISTYLKTTSAKYPKSFDDLVKLSNDPKFGYRSSGKAVGFKWQQENALELTDPVYLVAKNQGQPMIKAAVEALFTKYKLDAIVYPTSPRPAALIVQPNGELPPTSVSATNIGNIAGFPDLIVPAGMTKDGLPVTISFFGTAYTEAKLIGYGYDFEQATKAIVLPKFTPALPGDVVTY
jgi:amidase